MVQDRILCFIMALKRKKGNISDFTLQLTFKKVSLAKEWYNIKVDYTYVSEKSIKISSLF